MQAFIEFSNYEEAEFFRSSKHNKKYKTMFLLKINFTQKTHLRIKPNSNFEKAFGNIK